MAITKPTTSGFPDLKVVKKNEQVNLTLGENYEHLYTDQFTVAVGETYFSEALHGTEDTALFLWADDVLLLHGKNQIKYTNNTAAAMNIQLVVKLFDETNENGKMMPSGSYAMWKDDVAFSDGETELPEPPAPSKLCVNSRIYANNGSGEIFSEQKFGYYTHIDANTVFIFSTDTLYKYSSEGVFISATAMPRKSQEMQPNIDISIDEDGNGFIVIGDQNSDGAVGSGSGGVHGQGKVIVYDQDGVELTTIVNPNAYGDATSDRFGFSLAVSHEGTLVVTASSEEGIQGSGSGVNSYNSGVVYVFDIRNTANVLLLKTIDLANEWQFPEYAGSSTRLDVFGFGSTGRIILSNIKSAGGPS